MLTSRPTHGGGAPFGIDLEAGVARITVRRPADPGEAASGPALGEENAVGDTGVDEDGAGEAGSARPSASRSLTADRGQRPAGEG